MLCDSVTHSFIQIYCNSCKILGLNNHILQPHPIGHMLLDLYSKPVLKKPIIYSICIFYSEIYERRFK